MWVAAYLAVCLAASAGAEKEAARAYEAARPGYFKLKASPERQKLRHHWLRVIARFERVGEEYPGTPAAAKAWYTAGDLYAELAAHSYLDADRRAAIEKYERLLATGAQVSLADDALFSMAQLFEVLGEASNAARALDRLLREYPKGDMHARAEERRRTLDVQQVENQDVPATPPAVAAIPAASGRVHVTGLKHWSNPVYTRVVVYLDGPAEVGELVALPSAGEGLPPRVYLDLSGAAMAEGGIKVADVNDALLTRARLAQNDVRTVRLVLDLGAAADAEVEYNVSTLESPFRVVVDASTEQPRLAQAPKLVPKVVLDPGHGGHDTGALGYDGKKTHKHEKDVVLEIAKRLAARLRARGVDVVLTREDDTYVPLEERTALANRERADLFVSIHANSHRKESVQGIETYYLDVTDARYGRRLQARENAVHEGKTSEVQLVLADLATKVNTDASRELARRVQNELLREARAVDADTRDLGSKGALFYVLLGARMPAVLVETGFISNRGEGRRLAAAKYQRRLADGLERAIMASLTPTVMAARGE